MAYVNRLSCNPLSDATNEHPMTRPIIQLVTLAPGHFHAALVFKEMLPGIDAETHVFAPDDADLQSHCAHIARFNAGTPPTTWRLMIHRGDDWLTQFRESQVGTVAIIAGRNRPKLGLIRAALERGLHVLADKPCLIDACDLPEWARLLAYATEHGLLVRDMMTERYEATTIAQRQFIHDREQFGTLCAGTLAEPCLELTSVHHLVKDVAGVPLVRPTWWYDPTVAGPAVADVGTHLADLAQWLLFPDQALVPSDIEPLEVTQWPTYVPVDVFLANTKQTVVPRELEAYRQGEYIVYHGNGQISYRLRGHIVRWTVRWDVGPDCQGDTHEARIRGTQATSIIRYDPAYGPGPHHFVLRDGIATPRPIPIRTTHEAHFAAVLRDFIAQVHAPQTIAHSETANLLTKYHVTTISKNSVRII